MIRRALKAFVEGTVKYTHKNTHTHTHTNTRTYTHTQKHAHTHTHIYTHTRTHTHAHTHTHTHLARRALAHHFDGAPQPFKPLDFLHHFLEHVLWHQFIREEQVLSYDLSCLDLYDNFLAFVLF